MVPRNRGDMPTFLKSKRKRGFHRALKRKEQWAIIEYSMRHILDSVHYQMYDKMYDQVFKENPFVKMIGLKEAIDE